VAFTAFLAGSIYLPYWTDMARDSQSREITSMAAVQTALGQIWLDSASVPPDGIINVPDMGAPLTPRERFDSLIGLHDRSWGFPHDFRANSWQRVLTRPPRCGAHNEYAVRFERLAPFSVKGKPQVNYRLTCGDSRVLTTVRDLL